MKEDIVQYLINVKDPNISYKSQQFGDAELSDEDKRDIVTSLLDNRKFSEFFSRFGQFLNEHHLRYLSLLYREQLQIIIISVTKRNRKSNFYLFFKKISN